MTQFQKSVYAISIFAIVSTQAVFAMHPTVSSHTFNAPVVSSVASSSATFSVPVNNSLTDEEKKGVYFEYYQTNQVCIMIYPTPEYCLPKKTEVGKTSVTVQNLKSDTSYTVAYKRDNTIRCITTPCPDNSFASETVEFKTKTASGTSPAVEQSGANYGEIRKDLWFGHRGIDVIALQKFLIDNGYLNASSTGFFGSLTKKAVKDFQKNNNIKSTGYFGKLTNNAYKMHHEKKNGKQYENTTSKRMSHDSWESTTNGPAEKFEGVIQSFSTACFADGICSITIDGKTVVTTRGWSQEIVGRVIGIQDFGSIESKIGAKAKVYAGKTVDGYTLYGNKDYYVEIQ